MKALRWYLIVNAIVAAFFGLVMLLAPDFFTSSQGVTLTPNGYLFARALGGAVLSTAIVTWFARNLKDRNMMQGVLLMDFIVLATGAAVDAVGIFQGIVPTSGWFNIFFRGLLSVGFLYFLVKNPLK